MSGTLDFGVDPVNTQRRNNVVSKSLRRQDDVFTTLCVCWEYTALLLFVSCVLSTFVCLLVILVSLVGHVLRLWLFLYIFYTTFCIVYFYFTCVGIGYITSLH